MFGYTLEKLRSVDLNKENSMATNKFQEEVWQSVQVEKKIFRFVKTIYPNNVPKTLHYIQRPIRVRHPFSRPGGDCTPSEEVEDTLLFMQIMTAPGKTEEEMDVRRSHDLMHYADVMGMSVNKETGEVDYLNPQARRYYVGTSGDK
eukprot:3499376-Rhodomonas_salina.1